MPRMREPVSLDQRVVRSFARLVLFYFSFSLFFLHSGCFPQPFSRFLPLDCLNFVVTVKLARTFKLLDKQVVTFQYFWSQSNISKQFVREQVFNQTCCDSFDCIWKEYFPYWVTFVYVVARSIYGKREVEDITWLPCHHYYHLCWDLL